MRQWVLGLVLILYPPVAAEPPHEKEFWRQIASRDFQVPEGELAPALLEELNRHLGSPDPEWRDDLAYGTAAAWIYRDRRIPKAEIHPLLERLLANLQERVGESGTDSVLLRSFSALELSLIAALDNREPVLDAAEFQALLAAALRYLEAERDLRGYEPGKGWFHATAHTADLLKFLGRSRHLTVPDQGLILDAIAAKVAASGQAFTFGENERLARAVLSLGLRGDFDRAPFSAWLQRFPRQAKEVWARPVLDPAALLAVQNEKDLLRSLFVDLSLAEGLGPAAEAARAELLLGLKQME